MTTSAEIASYPSERRNSLSLAELPSVEYGLIRAHVFASLVTLVFSVLFGILVATKFTFPEFLGATGGLPGAGFATTIRRVYSSDGWATHSWLSFITPCRASQIGRSRAASWDGSFSGSGILR